MSHMWLIVSNKIALNVQKRPILLVKVVILMHMATGAARDRCKQVRKCQNCGTTKCNDCKFQVYECDLFTLWWSLCLLQLLLESSLQQLSKGDWSCGMWSLYLCLVLLGSRCGVWLLQCDSCGFFICKKDPSCLIQHICRIIRGIVYNVQDSDEYQLSWQEGEDSGLHVR